MDQPDKKTPASERGQSPLRRSENAKGGTTRFAKMTSSKIRAHFCPRCAVVSGSQCAQGSLCIIERLGDGPSRRLMWPQTVCSCAKMVRICGLVGALALVLGPAAVRGGSQLEGYAQTTPSDAGWLVLERDQRVYRERVEPLAPDDAADLRLLEERQRGELRASQQEERFRRQAPTRRSKVVPGTDLRSRQLEQREWEQLRLRGRIERESLDYHRR